VGDGIAIFGAGPAPEAWSVEAGGVGGTVVPSRLRGPAGGRLLASGTTITSQHAAAVRQHRV
jgi:hypothetical protein